MGDGRVIALMVALLVWWGPIVAVVGWSYTHPQGSLNQWGEQHPGWWWLGMLAAFFGLALLGVSLMPVVA